MAGSYQPQHFFAAKCVFTDFGAMITATIWMLVSNVSMEFFNWGYGTSGFFGAGILDAIFMAPGASKVVGSLKMTHKNMALRAIILRNGSKYQLNPWALSMYNTGQALFLAISLLLWLSKAIKNGVFKHFLVHFYGFHNFCDFYGYFSHKIHKPYLA